MDSIITSIVNATVVPMGNFIGWAASSGLLLIVFAVIWIGFGAAIVMNQGSLDAVWTWLRDQNIVVQGLIWLLFLPATVGLWIWETGWPMLLRLVLVAGLAGWSIFMFLPKAPPEA